MKSAADLRDSVEAFAGMCAALDHPFAERARILGDAGLDERGFGRLEETWTRRFLAAGGEELTRRFAEAHALARGAEPAQSGGRAPDGAAAGVGAVVGEVPYGAGLAVVEGVPRGPALVSVSTGRTPAVPSFMREPAPHGAAVVPVFARTPPSIAAATALPAETASIELSELLKPAMPFDPEGPPATAAAVPVVRPVAMQRERISTGTASIDVSAVPAAPVPLAPVAPRVAAPPPPEATAVLPQGQYTETMELDVSALLMNRRPQQALLQPAVPPPAATSVLTITPAPPGGPGREEAARRRLVRFDPQTGAPLAVPYWQDLPDTEEKK